MNINKQDSNQLLNFNISTFYYFSLKDNFINFLNNGIMPKNLMNKIQNLGIPYASFADDKVQNKRHNKIIILSNNKTCTIHDVVPVYLTPKTPTLFKKKDLQNNIIIVEIDPNIIFTDKYQFAFTDGNAASPRTRFYNNLLYLDKIPWNVINAKYWNDIPDGRRKRCSEFLIYPSIPPKCFRKIIVNNQQLYNELLHFSQKSNQLVKIEINTDYFFN